MFTKPGSPVLSSEKLSLRLCEMELAEKTVLRDKTEPVEPESNAIIQLKRQNQKFLIFYGLLSRLNNLD